MRIHHLRNATLVLTLGEHRLLVDPMLGEPASMPGFKMFGGGRQRNPLVPLPNGWQQEIDAATGILITHEHPDHLDQPGLEWIRASGKPVWASPMDAPSLRRKGAQVQVLEDGALGARVEIVPQKHGRGPLGWMMGPVSGVYLAHPDEPSVLLTSDAIWTDELAATLERLAPDVTVAPAGSANMGIGGDILFSIDELVRLVRTVPGEVVFNHLEALDHCPTRRTELRQRLEEAGVDDRTWVPEDGEQREFHAGPERPAPTLRTGSSRPGFRKWLTEKLSTR